MGKRKSVQSNETELPKEYEMNFEFFSKIHDELCLKHKNKFVAIKNQQVYSNRDPLKLLEILSENKIDPRYAVIEF